MKLTQLNINYDPELPFGMQDQSDQDPMYDAPEPWFPYSGSPRNGSVTVLGLSFYRKRINTGGFDPYAGDEWTLTFGPKYHEWFHFRIHNVICCEATVELSMAKLINAMYIATGFPWGWPKVSDRVHRRFKYRSCEYEWREMPWAWSLLWHFLEYRWIWFQYHDPGDYYDEHYWE